MMKFLKIQHFLNQLVLNKTVGMEINSLLPVAKKIQICDQSNYCTSTTQQCNKTIDPDSKEKLV